MHLSKRRHRVGPMVAKVLLWAISISGVGIGGSFAKDYSYICEQAAQYAARHSNVPFDVLMAISLTETGRSRDGKLRPWPWTVNMEGKGVWFDSQKEALDYSLKHHARGARSFDVGCFQLNYKWHGKAFRSIDHMFDPIENAKYAARFLTELYQETGDWARAAGAYHSRTPKYANKYTARFQRIRAKLSGDPIAVTPREPSALASAVIQPRINNFPLLQSGTGQNTLGSLFPGVGRTVAFIEGG